MIIIKIWLLFLILFSCCLTGCKSVTELDKNILTKQYTDIEATAQGSTVTLFMWGGDQNINNYIDNIITPDLKKNFDITLVRTPMNTHEFMQKLSNEKIVDKKNGSIDIIWINGENFKRAKEENLLLGDILSKLPNANNIKEELKLKDLGEDINGLEVPFGKVEFAFQYNSEYLKEYPKTFEDLVRIIKDNPGKFTYPEPQDFTGNTFVKLVALNLTDTITGQNGYLTDDDLTKTYNILQQLSPYLWKQGKTYPNSLESLDKLFADGEVYFTMGFNVNRATPFIEQGLFPEDTKTITISPNTITNCHYLSVPFNAPNSYGALTVINYLIGSTAQAKKADTSVWGDGTVLDLSKISKDEAFLFDSDKNSEVFGKEVLDLDAETTYKIRETWTKAIFEK